jgi:hypothetical protein
VSDITLRDWAARGLRPEVGYNWRRRRTPRACAVCGAVFAALPEARFCSERCRLRARAARAKSSAPPLADGGGGR